MTIQSFAWENDGNARSRVAVQLPDLGSIDTAEDFIRDAARFGYLERVRQLLGCSALVMTGERATIIREVALELAGSRDPALAISLLVHVTGAGDFAGLSLREHAERHGCSHEWFRLESERMRVRLELAASSQS